MNLAVQPNGVFQPLSPRKPKDRLDLRIHISFADTAIEAGHEYHGGNLVKQGSIPRVMGRWIVSAKAFPLKFCWTLIIRTDSLEQIPRIRDCNVSLTHEAAGSQTGRC